MSSAYDRWSSSRCAAYRGHLTSEAKCISLRAMTPSQLSTDVQYLTRPDGRISYTVTGDGPLVVAVPGMGDLRGTWRELVGPLVDAGFRVAVADLRGHGDADTTFTEH